MTVVAERCFDAPLVALGDNCYCRNKAVIGKLVILCIAVVHTVQWYVFELDILVCPLLVWNLCEVGKQVNADIDVTAVALCVKGLYTHKNKMGLVFSARLPCVPRPFLAFVINEPHAALVIVIGIVETIRISHSLACSAVVVILLIHAVYLVYSNGIGRAYLHVKTRHALRICDIICFLAAYCHMYRRSFPGLQNIIFVGFLHPHRDMLKLYRLFSIHSINNAITYSGDMLYRVQNCTSLYVGEHNLIGGTFRRRKHSLSVAVGRILLRVCSVVDIDIKDDALHTDRR